MAFDPTKIGAEFRYNDGTATLGPSTGAQLVPYDPYRVALLVQGGTAAVWLRPNVAAVTNVGFLIPANTAPLQFDLHSSGPLCQQRWFWFSPGGGQIYFLETLWVPPGG